MTLELPYDGWWAARALVLTMEQAALTPAQRRNYFEELVRELERYLGAGDTWRTWLEDLKAKLERDEEEFAARRRGAQDDTRG